MHSREWFLLVRDILQHVSPAFRFLSPLQLNKFSGDSECFVLGSASESNFLQYFNCAT